MQEEKQEVKQTENKMGTLPVNRLLVTMALPMIFSMLIQALYNIVDSIFVAQIGESALTAVSLAFPIQMLMIAVGTGIGVGINALLSKSLGEKEFDRANKAAGNGIFLSLIGFLIFLMIGIFGTKAFYLSQTADPSISDGGITYLTICCVGSIGIFMQLVFEKLLQSTGKTMYCMIAQGTGAIINIILDPILIFGLLGMPKMGIAGAAWATVIGQIIGATVAIVLNFTRNHEIKVTRQSLVPDAYVMKKILIVGVPSIVMQSIGSVMSYGINQILIAFTPTATAVFGIYFKLQSFIFMPIFGLNNGMIPIVAYNYGAGNRDRLMKAIKYSVIYAMGIMIIGLVVFNAWPAQLLSMFNASPEMLEIGVPALRIISINFIFAGYCIIVGSVFQALGNGVYSMLISIARQLIVVLPVAYILSKIGGLHAVWWAFPLAEIVSFILSTMFLVRIYHKVIKHIGVKAAA